MSIHFKRILSTFVFLATLQTVKAQQNERKESLKTLELSFGATVPVSRAYPKKDPHYSFGIGYAWDVDVAFIEARLDHYNRFSSDPSQHYTSFTAGGNYIFIDDTIWALFGGLNFGLGFAKVKGDDLKGGFHIGADVGALFLRDADVNLDLRLRLISNTSNLNRSHPFLVGFMAGIHF